MFICKLEIILCLKKEAHFNDNVTRCLARHPEIFLVVYKQTKPLCNW